MTKFKDGSFYDEAEATLTSISALMPSIGQIKTVRNENIIDDSADHNGWMLCNSRILLQAEYPDAFSVLGIYYNSVVSANDLTEFVLPFDHQESFDHFHNFIYVGNPV